MTTNLFRATEARLNITWSGMNGDLPDAVGWDLSDAALQQVALESVRAGSVPGIGADLQADFSDFVVDRFAATHEVPFNRLFVRPKTPFGGADADGARHGR
ncbi:MAG: hypothetical protein U1F43_31505 [Myxococcota bacterium]